MAGPTYTYTSDTPRAAQGFNLSQPEILNNFQAINELMQVNHVGFNTPNDFGKHKFIQMLFQGQDPVTIDSEIALFTKSTGSPNPSELFYRYPNNGTINQFSGADSEGTTPEGSSGVGWVKFSSGIQFKYGTATLNPFVTGGQDIVYPTGSSIPPFTEAVVYAHCTPTQSATYTFSGYSANLGNGLTNFRVGNVANTPQTVTVNWFAIGI